MDYMVHVGIYFTFKGGSIYFTMLPSKGALFISPCCYLFVVPARQTSDKGWGGELSQHLISSDSI